jgi:hypothetical protein
MEGHPYGSLKGQNVALNVTNSTIPLEIRGWTMGLIPFCLRGFEIYRFTFLPSPIGWGRIPMESNRGLPTSPIGETEAGNSRPLKAKIFQKKPILNNHISYSILFNVCGSLKISPKKSSVFVCKH